jgi:hypothetical protein
MWGGGPVLGLKSIRLGNLLYAKTIFKNFSTNSWLPDPCPMPLPDWPRKVTVVSCSQSVWYVEEIAQKAIK